MGPGSTAASSTAANEHFIRRIAKFYSSAYGPWDVSGPDVHNDADAWDVSHADDTEFHQSSFLGERTKEQTQAKGFCGFPIVYPYRHEGFLLELTWSPYMVYWLFTVFATYFMIIFTPFEIAYAPHSSIGLNGRQFNSYDAIALVLKVIFAVDIFVNFHVAYWDHRKGAWEVRPLKIALRYLRFWFWLDLVPIFPFESVVPASGHSTRIVKGLVLFRLARLTRVYNIWRVARFLEYSGRWSLLWLTIVRNLNIVLIVVHYGACMFWFVGEWVSLGDDDLTAENASDIFGWMQLDRAAIDAMPVFHKYVTSMYFSIVTLATVGYGDITPKTVEERVFVIAFITVNLGVLAFLTGTFTLVVTKGDEQAGIWRSNFRQLRDFIKQHEVPAELSKAMKKHLELHFANEQGQDDRMLAFLPSTLRKRALQHLFAARVRVVYLFQEPRLSPHAGEAAIKTVSTRFLDALLTHSKIELYVPPVDIVEQGAFVGELMILTHGCAKVITKDNVDEKGLDDQDGEIINPGSAIGEVAFFTLTAQQTTVRALEPCRVLSINRSTYRTLEQMFPVATRQVMSNLGSQALLAIQVVSEALKEALEKKLAGNANLPTGYRQLLRQRPKSEPYVSLAYLLQYAQVAPQSKFEQEMQRSFSKPDKEIEKVRQKLLGMQPAKLQHKWHAARRSLLSRTSSTAAVSVPSPVPENKSADPNLQAAPAAARKPKPLSEGAKLRSSSPPARVPATPRTATTTASHASASPPARDDESPSMKAAASPSDRPKPTDGGVSKPKPSTATAAVGALAIPSADDICNLHLERISAGRSVHMQGSTSNFDAVKNGVASEPPKDGDVSVRPGLKRTASDAHFSEMSGRGSYWHLQAQSVLDKWKERYMQAREVLTNVFKHVKSFEETQQALAISEVLSLAAANDYINLRQRLEHGFNPNTTDTSGRSPLMVAAAAGATAAVQELLDRGARVSDKDKFGGSALMDACRGGHHGVIQLLRGAGASVRGLYPGPEDLVELAVVMNQAVHRRQYAFLEALLESGAPPSAGDYNQRTPLHIAAMEANYQMATLLLKHGADIYYPDRWGNTPVTDASLSESTKIFFHLLSQHARNKEHGRVTIDPETGDMQPPEAPLAAASDSPRRHDQVQESRKESAKLYETLAMDAANNSNGASPQGGSPPPGRALMTRSISRSSSIGAFAAARALRRISSAASAARVLRSAVLQVGSGLAPSTGPSSPARFSADGPMLEEDRPSTVQVSADGSGLPSLGVGATTTGVRLSTSVSSSSGPPARRSLTGPADSEGAASSQHWLEDDVPTLALQLPSSEERSHLHRDSMGGHPKASTHPGADDDGAESGRADWAVSRHAESSSSRSDAAAGASGSLHASLPLPPQALSRTSLHDTFMRITSDKRHTPPAPAEHGDAASPRHSATTRDTSHPQPRPSKDRHRPAVPDSTLRHPAIPVRRSIGHTVAHDRPLSTRAHGPPSGSKSSPGSPHARRCAVPPSSRSGHLEELQREDFADCSLVPLPTSGGALEQADSLVASVIQTFDEEQRARSMRMAPPSHEVDDPSTE